MNIAQFIKKYADSTLKEEAVAQQHFLDLCDLLQHPKPADLADSLPTVQQIEAQLHI